MTNTITVVVADHYQSVRDGLGTLLNGLGDIEVLGSAVDAVEAFTMTRQLCPDVLVMDIAMPKMNGFAVVESIRRAVPETRIVIHSMYEKEAYIHQAFSAGAMGYVLKAAPSTDIINAIRCVAGGEYFTSSTVRSEFTGD